MDMAIAPLTPEPSARFPLITKISFIDFFSCDRGEDVVADMFDRPCMVKFPISDFRHFFPYFETPSKGAEEYGRQSDCNQATRR